MRRHLYPRLVMNNGQCDTLETCGKGIFHQIGGLNDQDVAKCCAPAQPRVATHTKRGR
jgi:hypothetical protein